MNKKIFFVATMSMVMALAGSSSFASGKNAGGKKAKASSGRAYGMAGCGLGSMAMGKDGNQVLASTTNSTFDTQFFGITTGTSNCVDSQSEEVAQRMDRFVVVNKVALANDMARGNGETLAALASIAGCSDTAQFGTVMQKNFHGIYSDAKVGYTNVTDNVIETIMNDQGLKKDCQNLI